jgi:hypothetical protein
VYNGVVNREQLFIERDNLLTRQSTLNTELGKLSTDSNSPDYWLSRAISQQIATIAHRIITIENELGIDSYDGF